MFKDIIYKNIHVYEYRLKDGNGYCVRVESSTNEILYNYLFKEKVNKAVLFEIAKKHSKGEIYECELDKQRPSGRVD